MKKIFTLFIVFLFFFHVSSAQDFEWLETVEVDYEFNPGMISYNACYNPQGGCFFYGIQEHVSFYNESMGILFLKKYGQDGEEIWSRSVLGQSMVAGMVCDDDGNVFISGQMLTDADFWGEGNLVKTGIGTDGFLGKVSSEGGLDWIVNLTGLPMGEGTVSEVQVRNDMLYVGYSTWMDTYVLIFTGDGEYVNSVMQEDVSVISGLDFDSEGNLYTTGSCAGWQASFAGVPYPAPFSYTTYLVKYNSSFEPVWVKYVEDITCTFPQVKTGDEGGIYFAGQIFTATLFDSIQVNGPAWAYDFFLAKLNQDGQYQWVTECPEVLTGDATVGNSRFLDKDMDGNILLTGITRGIVEWGNGVISDVTGNSQDLIILSFNADGQVNWAKTAGGAGYDQPHSISAGTGGNAYIAGVVSGTVTFDTIIHETTGLVDPFLTRLDLEIMTGIPVSDLGNGLKIYPNPAKERIFIESDKGMELFRILNMHGQEVKSGTLSGIQQAIVINDLHTGFYFLEISGKSNEKKSTKLLIY